MSSNRLESGGNLWRAAIVTGAFLLAVMVLIVGAVGRGETTENAVEDACESAVWPMIPTTCFSRERAPYVRPVRSMEEAGAATSLVEESGPPGPGAAFGKADLLRAPDLSMSYRTVETRGDGISVLQRVGIGSRDQVD